MARVAVVHNKFSIKGGAETVCMNTLEALQGTHDLRLFSFDEPDFEELNAFCGTDVDTLPTRYPERLESAFNRSIGVMNTVTGGRFGSHIKLKTALLNRIVYDWTTDFDVVVSTGNDLALPGPSVQYVHFPMFNGRLDDEFGTSGLPSSLYDLVCTRLGGVTPETIRSSTVLTNSEWTADVIENRYGVRPTVVYPPVNTGEFTDVPLTERENGFVTLGRVSSDKRTRLLIDVIDAVRSRGHDVHLHVVGPYTDDTDDYGAQVKAAAEAREYVFMEGEVSRRELVELVSTHRYGIHGKRNEHFGITVAELVAGGTLPFVAEGGGQVELVNRQPELIYSNREEAVELIDDVLSDRMGEQRLRESLPDVKSDLSQSRFQNQIRDIVNEQIG